MGKVFRWISPSKLNGNIAVIFLVVIATSWTGNGAQISFTKPVYRVGIYQGQDIRKYVTHYDFQMGIKKPKEDGDMIYRIRDSSEILNTFEPESKLIGDFYYLRIRTKYSASINREIISLYNLTIEALFENKLSGKSPAECRTQVLIKVLDRNDNCPMFTKEKFEFSVFDNASLSTQVGVVSATDADEGINSEIFYYSDLGSLQSELKRFPFSIDMFSGTIHPTESLRPFVGQKLVTKVSATHRGDPSLVRCDRMSHAQISVLVIADNVHAPQISINYLRKQFDPMLDDVSYAEISVYDEDDNTRVQKSRERYPISIKGPSEPSPLHFQLQPTGKLNQYVLKLRALSSNRPASSSVTVTIEASDLGSNQKSSTIQITIVLAQFRNIDLLSVPAIVSVTVSEAALINSSIALLKSLINATNADSLNSLRFSLNPDADPVYDFSVSTSGVVSVSQQLNAEDYASRLRTISVAVFMSDWPADKKIFSVRVSVEDINEFAPVVTNNGSTVRAKENADPDEPVFVVDAYDPDISRTRLTFYLLDQERLPFRLGGANGNALLVRPGLDAETMARQYNVRVLVSDSGLPLPRSVLAQYTVDIEDENEYKPAFAHESCNIDLSRDTPYDHRLGQFSATDFDRDGRNNVRISIAAVSVQMPCFSINGRTGVLVLLCSLRNRVLARLDNFTIELLANDTRFLSRRLTLNVTVVEPGSEVLGQDGGDGFVRVVCKNDGLVARMESDFGRLRADHWANFSITAPDGLGLSQPYDGAPPAPPPPRTRPTFSTNMPKTVHVREEVPRNHHLLSISMKCAPATNGDPYECQFIFGIWAVGGDLPFALRQTEACSASLVVADRVDRESRASYLLTIAVCDMGSPRLCTVIDIDVRIEDINDNRPRFVDAFQWPLPLPENYKVGRRLVQVAATDADALNTGIQYRLENHQAVFRMHKRTGWLKLRRELDREQVSRYELIITAIDQSVNSRPLTATLTLVMLVTDVNDNRPLFATSRYSLTLPQDAPIGSFLVQLRASDLDEGANGQLRYALHGIDSQCFRCDERTGTVHLLCKLSLLTEYRLIALVKDHGTKQQLSSQADFHIIPLKMPSHRSVANLIQPLISASVRENCIPNTLVTTLSLDDGGEKPARKYLYTISGQSTGLSLYHINNDGEIRTTGNIDRERSEFHWLYVYIEDHNDDVVHKILAEIYIDVIDDNDNYPMPDQAFYRASIKENLQTIQPILTIHATDNDANNNSTVIKYKIISGDPMGFFSISPTGTIFTTERPIDRESLVSSKSTCAFADFYDLKIMISDSGKPERINTVNAHISIIDINDNAPTFINNNQFIFNRYLSPATIIQHQSNNENLFIGRVTAVDIDYDLNGTVRYTLLTPRSAGIYPSNNKSIIDLFSIDSKTGRLYTNLSSSVFGNWTNNTSWSYVFHVKVWAFDLGVPTLWSVTPASVTVKLFQAMNMTISKSEWKKTNLYLAYQLPESIPLFYDECIGYEMLPIPVVDPLDPRGTNLEASISNSNGPFSVLWAHRTTATRYMSEASLVIAESLINHPEKSVVTITICNYQMCLEHNLTISVKFYNKNAPVFRTAHLKPLTINIDDYAKAPKLIYQAQAFVPPPEFVNVHSSNQSSTFTGVSDSIDPIIYSISASNDPKTVQELFYLHSNNGDLNLIRPVNEHRNETFQIIIEARNKKATYMKLNIHISDTNNMFPEFLISRDKIHQYMEMLGTIVKTPSLTLSEIDKLAIQYHLDNNLIVSFSWIDESAVPGTLLTSVSASDQDAGHNGELIYHIKNDSIASRYFQIDAVSGNIRVKTHLNPIVNRILFLTVIVNDNGHQTRSNQSVVGVEIRDNTFVRSQPRLEKSHLELVVMENASVNTVLHCLKLRPLMNPPMTPQFLVISTKPTEAKLFSVTRSTGCIVTISSLDREVMPEVVSIEIQVQTYNGLVAKYNSIVTVKIHITDVNDNPPRFLGPLRIHGVISESANPGSLVFVKNNQNDSDFSLRALVINTEDPDEGLNGQIDYIIQSEEDSYFKIDRHTGVLSLASKIDREVVGDTVIMTVQLIDGGSPPLRSQERLEIFITVNDDNDSPPKFEEEFYIQNLVLPTFANAQLLQLRAKDPDLDSKIVYSITAGNNDRFFTIHPDTGWLSVNAARVPTSKEIPTVLLIHVRASDGKFDTKCNITIYSFDDALTRPLPLERNNVVWDVPENRLNVPDLVLPRTKISYATLKLESIKYILLSEHPSISIDQSAGYLKLSNTLDRELQPYFSLLVLARGWDGSHGYINVTVNVTDENDYKPWFLSDQYEFLVHTNQSVGLQSMKVKAIDLDAGDNGTVSYSIYFVKPYTYDLKFAIDSTTGVISVQEGPTETLLGKKFTIGIKASDRGQPSMTSFANVVVDIVSDKSPLFEHTNYSVLLSEDSVKDRVVTTVRAASSTGHTILYTITIGNEDELFELDFTTGVIRLIGSLDYETNTHYSLVISATDPSSSLSHSTTVSITVLDCPDERPSFSQRSYVSSISENAPIDHRITTISIRHQKERKSKKVEYSLKDVDGSHSCSSQYFQINKTTGVLSTRMALDFERCPSHEFWVEVKYEGEFFRMNSTIMRVLIIDENDNPPKFLHPSFHTMISLESEANSLVVVAMATDPDTNSKLQYKILNENRTIFKIDQRSGFIYFNPRPNFKQILPPKGIVEFQVLVHDSVHSVMTNITVEFISTRNHAPLFRSKQITMAVPENATVGARIGQLLGSDIDTNKFGSIQYQIIGGFDSQCFALNSQSGVLSIKEKLDRESRSRYELRVAVSDGGSKHDFANVLIHVTDINDNVPVLDQSYYEVTVVQDPDQYPTTSASILQLHARDKDQSSRFRMDYRVVFPSLSDSPVTIDAITGQISMKTSWRTMNSINNTKSSTLSEVHRLLVQVCEEPIVSYRFALDPQSCSAKVPVTLNIFYQKDKQNPVITCSIKSVTENNILLQLVAVCRISPNDSKGKWALVPNNSLGDIQNDFEIDMDFGYIRAKRIMDYEAQSFYRINVEYRVQNSPLIATRSIVIDLTDVDDCYPIFDNSRYTISISEDLTVGSRVIQCKALDLDFDGKDKVFYSIAQHNSTAIDTNFRIDEHGWVYLMQPLDYEKVNMIHLTVSASDKGGHVTNTSLTVSVFDVNDEVPYWVRSPPSDEIEIMEMCDGCTKDLPKVVYRVDARDNDTESQKQSIRFIIANQNMNPFYAFFQINDNGEVILSQPLDAEKISGDLQLKLLATDRLHWSEDQFTLNIRVLDANDHTPICPQIPDITITEGVPPGTIVTQLQAIDRDASSKYNTITYKLMECSDPFLLIVDRNTGQVIINAPLDREFSSIINVVIGASDIDGRNCLFHVKIIVADVNDNAPKFTHTDVAPLLENAPFGSVVGKIHAVDPDTGLNRQISYRLAQESKSSFSIDKSTGIIRVSGVLDREQKAEHSLIVEAIDSGKPSKSSRTKVNIVLLDVNDSPPQFLNTPLRINVSEDVAVGSQLMTVRAVSDDVGINAIVTYRIIMDQDQFSLNETSGALTLMKKLDYEKNRELFLNVEASDKGYPSLSTTTGIAIQISDVNDNTPQFPSQPYLFTIMENSPIGKLIGKITAIDADTEFNSKVTYSFLYWLPDQKWPNRSLFNHVDHFFRLNADTGEIFLKFVPDREEQSIYKFQVMASDQGVPSLSATTNIDLEIEDMNDNPPSFSESTYRFLIQVDRSGIIPEGELKKHGDLFEVGKMTVSDKDGPTNSRPFHCKLLNAETSGPFSVKSDQAKDECILLVTGSLHLGIRNLLIQVNDNGLTTLYQRVRVVVDVIRLSNIPPEIEPLNASYVYFHSSDSIKKDSEIARVLVRDRSPAFDMLKFDLIFNDTNKPQNRYLNNLFKIDPFTGVLTTSEQLDSGTYALDVRVTNGTLFADRIIFIKIIALTSEMVESAAVIQVSAMKPNLFFARKLDVKLVHFLKSAMGSKLAYIISIKASSRRKMRVKRQLVPDDVIDVLVAVYNENENRFFKGSALVSRINTLVADLAKTLEANTVRIFDSVCNDKHVCVQGQCQTTITVDPKHPPNIFTVHGVTFSSLDFNYESSCKCSKFFGGNRCEIPLNKCAHKPCGSVRICRPDPTRSPGYVCDCPAFKDGKFCEKVIDNQSSASCLDEQCLTTRESEPIHFTGGGYLKWIVGPKSQTLRIDISFGFRLVQKPAPLMEISWNSLRSILIDIDIDGRIIITADHKTIPPFNLFQSRNPVADDKWHNIRLAIVGVANIPGWWLHVVLDGLIPRSLNLESWVEGDSFNQSIVIGARNYISASDRIVILNETMTGCIKDVILNGQRLPYQQLPAPHGADSIKVQSRNLNYGCAESFLKSICATGVCRNGGMCLNRNFGDDPNKSYVCQCQEIYTGKHCEIYNSPCRFSPCYHGGRCVETGKGYRCICPEGLLGPRCQWGRACSSVLNPCPQYSTCLEQQSGAQYSNAICRCPDTLQGYLCQLDVDECQIRPPRCQPGRGVCHNTHGGYQCNCSLGYGGKHCEIDSMIPILPDTSSFGLSQFHIYVIVGVLACLFVLALLAVVILVLRTKPINGLHSHRKKDRSTALSLDPLYQYKVYTGDQCSRYSPASSMMASSIHHPPGYVGGYMVEPPSTPGGRSQMSYHQAAPSHYGHLSQDDRASLCSSNNDKREPNGLAPAMMNQNSRYIRSGRGQMYLNPTDSRQRLTQHASTFSLVPCNVGPQQHLHLVPNRNSVLFCPANNHPRLVYDPMVVRNSNLSLHSSHALSAQWGESDNRLGESVLGIMSPGHMANAVQDTTPVNGEIDHSMISWNGQYGEEGMFHREMISSQEMSITDTTDRSTAHLLPKVHSNRINLKMQPPVIHQISISKPVVLTSQNNHSDSPNTVSPSSGSIPSGTSSDTKGTAPECEPRDPKKKGNKISPDSNSGEGTECDTEDLEMDHQPLCATVFSSSKHLQEDAEDGLSSVPLLDSIN